MNSTENFESFRSIHVLTSPAGSDFIQFLTKMMDRNDIPYYDVDTGSDHYELCIGCAPFDEEDIDLFYDDIIVTDWKHFDFDDIEHANYLLEPYGYTILSFERDGYIMMVWVSLDKLDKYGGPEQYLLRYLTTYIPNYINKYKADLERSAPRMAEIVWNYLYIAYFGNFITTDNAIGTAAVNYWYQWGQSIVDLIKDSDLSYKVIYPGVLKDIDAVDWTYNNKSKRRYID